MTAVEEENADLCAVYGLTLSHEEEAPQMDTVAEAEPDVADDSSNPQGKKARH